jgi:hypothetical protein
VIDEIKKRTGTQYTIDEYEKLDTKEKTRLLGTKKMSIKTGRRGPHLNVRLIIK